MNIGSFSVAIPLTADDVASLADYIELNAICSKDASISARDVASQTNRALDEEVDRGTHGEVSENVSAAFAEIGRRQDRSPNVGQYPFTLDESGDLVRYEDQPQGWLYVFCLIATRSNMNLYRKQRGIDATKLFEEVSAYVLRHHVKVDEAIVIGTARQRLAGGNGLQAAIQHFLTSFREAGGYENRWAHGTSGDGGCDVIGWHSQLDERFGKATVFCSCKTGTSWKESSDYKPVPREWSDAYVMSRAFVVDPIPCLVVAEALSDHDYGQKVEQPRLLAFDRTRVAAASHLIPNTLRRQCMAWSKLAGRRALGMPFGAL